MVDLSFAITVPIFAFPALNLLVAFFAIAMIYYFFKFIISFFVGG